MIPTRQVDRIVSTLHAALAALLLAASCSVPIAARAAEVARSNGAASETTASNSAASNSGTAPKSASRPQDQVWLINTRCLGCPPANLTDTPKLDVWRHDARAGWKQASVAAFLAAQSAERQVCVHMHGARTDHGEAVPRGLELYRRVTSGAPEAPISFVIWSWPTSPAGRPLRDLRAMASRSDSDACYLAWLLARLDPHTRVELFGFSYGARMATGALHLLAGGSLLGRSLPRNDQPERTPINAVLWTPALNNDWLLPNNYHGRAVECLDRMLIVYNPCDRAMSRYHLVAPCGCGQGLGFTGLAGRAQLGKVQQRIEQWNGSGDLGSEHSFYNHMYSTRIMQMTREALFVSPPPTATSATVDASSPKPAAFSVAVSPGIGAFAAAQHTAAASE
jgi:hypothetical protein